MLPANLPSQPSPRKGPRASGSSHRHTHRGGCLIHAHPDEIPQLNQVRRDRLLLGQQVECVINREQFLRPNALHQMILL
jgi:hypothetical protein